MHKLLFPFRDRIKFTQYIPSDSAKFGIKVWPISNTKVLFNSSQIYAGNELTGQEMNRRVVMDLSQLKQTRTILLITRNLLIETFSRNKENREK